MTEWRKVKLGDVCEISAGGDRPQLVSDKETDICHVPIYSNGVDNDGLYGFTDKEKIKGNSITITARGANVGTVFYRKTAYYPIIRLLSLQPNEELVNSRYLYYLIKDKTFLSTGSAQPQITVPNISKYVIEYDPDVVVQRRIAEVLSRYDALIENYQRQIKLLEEAAQRLYKEWFVDLRFPGHQSTPIINNLPQGWQKKTVEECLIFHGNGGWGKDSPTGKYEHPGKVIRGTDIEDIKTGRYNDLPLRFHTDNDMKKRTLKKDDLVFELSNGNINNIGRCLFIDEIILKNTGDNTICASFCKLLRPIDRFHALMLYWEIQDMQTSGRMLPLKKQGANGINNFDFDGFLSHVLLIPSDESLISPLEVITKNIGRTLGEIALLSEARDRLLPKLMNAEIVV